MKHTTNPSTRSRLRPGTHTVFTRSSLLLSALGMPLVVHGQTNGTWTQATSGGSWSSPANWASGTIADGAGAIADFTTLDLPEGIHQAILDGNRTVGDLRFGDASPATAGTWELAGTQSLTISGGSAIITTAVDTSFGTGVILGGNGFTKAGTGKLLLRNTAPALTGDVRITAGTLALGAGAGIGTGGFILSNGSTLRLDAPGQNAIGNAITLEAGANAVFSSANLTNGYGGTIGGPSDAVLEISGPISFGVTGAQQFANFGGTVRIPSGSQLRFSATGTGANGNGGTNATFEVNGLVNTRNRADSTGVAIGALTGSGQLQGQTNTAASSVVYRVGGKNIDSTFAGTFVNGAQGTAHLNKLGTGKLTLTGDSPATGNITITGGQLQLGNGGSTGSFSTPSIAISAGTQLLLNRDGTLALASVLSGAGTLVQQGPGTTVLSGNNAHGSTEITGGTLEISSESNLGAGPVSFPSGQGVLSSAVPGLLTSQSVELSAGATGGLAARDADDSLVHSGVISGSGSLSIGGTGSVVLSGANGFTGTTTVATGTLVVSNTSGSATGSGQVQVTGGTLAGAGTVSGSVQVSSTGLLRPGDFSSASSAVGTLKTGPLSLAGGSTLFYEFGGAGGNDTIDATSLTATASAASPVLLDLRLENSSAKLISPGTYPLISFSGSFSGNANDLFEVAPASVQGGLTYAFSISSSTLVLTITGGSASAWKNDANGTWATAGNWVNGIPNNTGSAVTFGTVITQPRTVTVGAAAKAGSLTFDNANRYTLSGAAALTLQASSGNASISVLQGSHVINTAVVLSSNLEVTPAHAEDSVALGGIISGSGRSIVKNGAGSLSLTANNTLTGGVSLNAGTLRIGPSGLGSGDLRINGGTLLWNSGSQDITASRNVSFGDQPVVFDTNGNDVLLSQPFGGGAASLTLTGGATVTIADEASHTGGTIIENGTLRLGNNGTAGSVQGGIINHGELVLRRSDQAFVNSPISGPGILVHSGSGSAVLTAANTFTGYTSIPSGKLEVGHSLALQNSTVSYDVSGGALGFHSVTEATLGGLEGTRNLLLENDSSNPVSLSVGNNGSSSSYGGNLSGSGSFIKTGSGTLALDGTSAFTGNTEVRGGTLEQPAGSISTGSLLVAGTSRFSISGGAFTASAGSNISNVGGSPAFELFAGSAAFPGGLNATGNQNLGYVIRVGGGTLTASSVALARSTLIYNAEPAAGDTTRGLYLTGGSVEISGNLDIGTAPGVNVNSSVSTRVDGGTLKVNGVTTLGQVAGSRWSVLDVNGGSYVSTDAVSGVILGGPVTGSGALLVQAGSATVERIQLGQAANAGSGILAVSGSGVINIGSGGIVPGSSNPAFVSLIRLGKTGAAGGTLGAKASWSTSAPLELAGGGEVLTQDAGGLPQEITLAGPILGAGGLTKTGVGTLSITGAAAYTGTTRIQAGTFRITSPALADAAAVEINGTGVLRLDHSGTDTVAALVIDNVAVANGVWGAPGSGAPNTSPRLAGTGRLRIGTVVEDPYATWASLAGLTGNDALRSADPDGDGQPNLLEYALDGNPKSAKASGKVVSRVAAVTGGNAFVLTLPVRTGASFSGTTFRSATVDNLIYQIEGSNDLLNYDQTVTEVVPALDSGLPELTGGWTYRSFRLAGDPATRGQKGFLRAKVQGTTP